MISNISSGHIIDMIKFQMATQRTNFEIPINDENDVLQITALGAGNEVGRSCLVIQYKGKTVMV